MKINKNDFYVIIQTDKDNVVTDWFHWRVYPGRYVMSAYNQMKNKETYKIYKLIGLQEVTNEN